MPVAPNLKIWRIQLKDSLTGQAIITSGGTVYVATAGGSKKVALKTSAGATASNPSAATRGLFEFYTLDTVQTVDLYGMAPGGQFFVAKGIAPSGPNEIAIDTNQRYQAAVIPFDQTDFTAAAETDSGFDVPNGAMMLPNPMVRVTAIDATETIDAGTAAGESGVAAGFMATVSIATLGLAKASLANGALTMGALLFVQDSANAGDEAPEGSVSQGGKSIVYTTSAGSDTGIGFIVLPYMLSAQ